MALEFEDNRNRPYTEDAEILIDMIEDKPHRAIQYISELIQDTTKKELQEAARLICSLCAKGEPVEHHPLCHSMFAHPVSGDGSSYLGCSATRIWERLEEIENS